MEKIKSPGKLLKAYIVATHRNVLHFCTLNKLDPASIGRLIGGQSGRRISAQLAFDLEKATGGSVRASAWVKT